MVENKQNDYGYDTNRVIFNSPPGKDHSFN